MDPTSCILLQYIPQIPPIFNLEDGADFLKVYDGSSLLQTLTGPYQDALRSGIASTSSVMRLEFTR